MRRQYVQTQQPPPLTSSAVNWPALPTSNRFEPLASSRSRSKGREKSPRGFKNRDRSRSQRSRQRVALQVNHSLPPPKLGLPPRLDSRSHNVISPIQRVISQAPPPTRQVSGPANPPSAPTSTPPVNPLCANTSSPQNMQPITHSLPASTPPVNPLSAPTSSSQVIQPSVTHTDIQNIVRGTLDQILPSLLRQIVNPLLSQALAPILATLQDLTARLASLEEDRLPHERAPASAEDGDSMQNE